MESFPDHVTSIESLRNDIQAKLQLQLTTTHSQAYAAALKRKLELLAQRLKLFQEFLDSERATDAMRSRGSALLGRFYCDLELAEDALNKRPRRHTVAAPITGEEELLRQAKSLRSLAVSMEKELTSHGTHLEAIQKQEEEHVQLAQSMSQKLYEIADIPSNWCLIIAVIIEVVAILLIIFVL